MKPVSGESAPDASMSRSDSSRDVSSSVSSESRASGRSPVRWTSSPPCGAISFVSVATLMQDQLRALLRRMPLGLDPDVGLRRLLVGVVDAGEALDLAPERLLVQPLDV